MPHFTSSVGQVRACVALSSIICVRTFVCISVYCASLGVLAYAAGLAHFDRGKLLSLVCKTLKTVFNLRTHTPSSHAPPPLLSCTHKYTHKISRTRTLTNSHAHTYAHTHTHTHTHPYTHPPPHTLTNADTIHVSTCQSLDDIALIPPTHTDKHTHNSYFICQASDDIALIPPISGG